MKLAICFALDRLLAELALLIDAMHDKGRAFAGIVKVGRTQLQDAVPMTLGQEFGAVAVSLNEDRAVLADILPMFWQINMGATAVGTGITAPPDYSEEVRNHLAEITGFELRTATHLVAATSDMGVFMHVAGVM